MSSVVNGRQGLNDAEIGAAAEHASRVLLAFISCAKGKAQPAASLLKEAKQARSSLNGLVDALNAQAVNDKA